MSYSFPAGAPHDDLKGRGVGSITGDPFSRRGMTRPVYTPLDEEDSESELDDYVDTLITSDVEDDIHAKINTSYHGGVDSYVPRGSRQYFVGGNTIAEFAGNHRNPIRHGISPYKQPKHGGPPLGTGAASQAFRTTGNFRRTGTQYGSSRPHKILTNIEDENIFSMNDMLEPMERSFRRHNNRVKKILNLIKESLF